MKLKKIIAFLALVLLIVPTAQHSGGSSGGSSTSSGDGSGSGGTTSSSSSSSNNKAYYHTGSVITVIIIGSSGEHNITNSDMCPVADCLAWDPAGKRCGTVEECEAAEKPMSVLAKMLIGIGIAVVVGLCCLFCYYKNKQEDDGFKRDK